MDLVVVAADTAVVAHHMEVAAAAADSEAVATAHHVEADIVVATGVGVALDFAHTRTSAIMSDA